MTARTRVHGLEVATDLHRFIEDEVLPGTGVESGAFWKGFDLIVSDLAPKNIALLAERDRLQSELEDAPKDPGLVCAEARLPASSSWLEDQLPVIKGMHADVDELLAPLTVIE